jgi:hypothetical protein
LRRGLDREVTDLPVGQIKQLVKRQIGGWVERFAKPIAVGETMMGIAALHPSYALDRPLSRTTTTACVALAYCVARMERSVIRGIM